MIFSLIDDGSTDQTHSTAGQFSVPTIQLTHGGLGKAVQQGTYMLWENDYDIVVQIDGDGQHDPRLPAGIN